jgi:two-component system OmpR family response regulator
MAEDDMSDANHIAILDDDPEIRSLLEQNLRSSGFEVSTASSGRDLKTILEHQTIDLVVLDLMLPGEDGLTICRELRTDSNIPIIMLTAMTHEADRIIGLEMGADDYLTKPFSPRELVARIKATLRRQGMVSAQSEDRKRVATFEGWKLDVVRRELRDPEDVLVDLTSGEFDLLAALIDRPNRLMTRDLLLDITKGRQADVFDRSIDITISRLRQKIEDDPKNPQFIKTVRGKGYIFSAEIG